MTKRILIIGGYGNFGSYIAKALAHEPHIQLIITGRNKAKAQAFAASLDAKNPAIAAWLDTQKELQNSLKKLHPDMVIHTSGPFQGQGYEVAEACIQQGCHYVDLADARDFVCGIIQLDDEASKRDVLVCSGASSVPCLSSAIIDQYQTEFATLEKVDYAISTAQKTSRGFATTSAVLSYAGKPFTTLIDGEMRPVYGWLGLRFRRFWKLNNRPLGNCDIPDLELFPKRYPSLKTVRFQAGLEIKMMHLGLNMMSWLVRFKLLKSIQPMAKPLLKMSNWFDPFGKDDSGFYTTLSGLDESGKPKEMTFNLVACQGDGLYIPAMPAIILARKYAHNALGETGATPCVGIITLDEYMAALSALHIEWQLTE